MVFTGRGRVRSKQPRNADFLNVSTRRVNTLYWASHVCGRTWVGRGECGSRILNVPARDNALKTLPVCMALTQSVNTAGVRLNEYQSFSMH
jgi:hypothetical protein